jgi:hypothetical protein
MKISREEFKDFMITFSEISDMSLRAAEFIDESFIEKVVASPVFWFADSIGVDSRILFPAIRTKDWKGLDSLYDSLPDESKSEVG